MLTGPWPVLAIAIIVAVLVGLMVLYVPVLGTRHRRSPGDHPPRLPSYPSSLIKGVGYLFGAHRSYRRSDGVTGRFDRAVARIDQVDPYAAPRRIGLAMVQAGLVDAPSPADAPVEEQPTHD
jgi:hypothetical protein